MKYLVLDLETVPINIEHEEVKDYLMDKKISKEMRSLDPNYSKIVVVVVKELNGSASVFSGEEKQILIDLWKFLENKNDFILVTHNGYQFDIPFLIIRSITNNVSIPIDINTNKWRMENSNHFDTMQFFSHYGTFINPNLNILARIQGVNVPKRGVKGSDIENLYKEGKLEDIKKHCIEDVEILENLFKKSCISYVEGLKGNLKKFRI